MKKLLLPVLLISLLSSYHAVARITETDILIVEPGRGADIKMGLSGHFDAIFDMTIVNLRNSSAVISVELSYEGMEVYNNMSSDTFSLDIGQAANIVFSPKRCFFCDSVMNISFNALEISWVNYSMLIYPAGARWTSHPAIAISVVLLIFGGVWYVMRPKKLDKDI